MKTIFILLLLVLAILAGQADIPPAPAKLEIQEAADPSTTANSWIDPTTGHKVVRIYRGEGSSSSLYFHQNSFTPNGDKIVFTHNNWLYAQDISPETELGSGKTTPVVETGGFPVIPVVGHVTREVYYLNVKERNLSSTNLDTLQTRVIVTFPSDWDLAPESFSGLTINSDDTLLAGAQTKGLAAIYQGANGARQGHIDAAFNSHLPTFLWTVDIKTGQIKKILEGKDFFNHVQFSPTDPTLLLFCHEGPWQKVDRIWTVHTDGSGLTNVHPRQAEGDAYGHEFWSADGKTIWSDFGAGGEKTRRLVGRNLITGEDMSYQIGRDQMSRHYNISHDGKLFVGDGEPSNANPMIRLLIPQSDGTFLSKSLCSIAKNNFVRKEPNVRFSPDDKWVIFSSTQSGEVQAYAVQVGE
jgi:oligogalacturonide lyase